MQRGRRLCSAVLRFRWELGALLLVLVLGACSDVGVDPNTANITHRPKDTLILIDTSVVHDTTVHVDTIYSNGDTLYERDTLVEVRTVIRTVRVVVVDTVRVPVLDTLRDTLHDTIRLVSPELRREGMLYRILHKPGQQIVADSAPVKFDDLTRFNVVIRSGVVTSIQLRMIGRVATLAPDDTAKWGVSASWFYLFVPTTELAGGQAARDLVADPRASSEAGMAIIPRAPWMPLWLTTKPPASDANRFTVTRVDAAARRVYCNARARFDKFDAAVDSLAFWFAY